MWKKWLSTIQAAPQERFASRIMHKVRMFNADKHSFQIWLRQISAVDAVLGVELRRDVEQFLSELADEDVLLCRSLVLSIPEELSKVSSERRREYLEVLREVKGAQLEALSIVSSALPELMLKLGSVELRAFVSEALVIFLDSRVRMEAFLKLESQEALDLEQHLSGETLFSSLRRSLQLYAQAHCGEDVQIFPSSDRAYTDGRHIYLPRKLSYGDLNESAYRTLTARSAGYIEFGTLNLRLTQVPHRSWTNPKQDELEIERLFRSFENSSLAKDLFFIFEDYRIEQQLRGSYPGVARDIDLLVGRMIDPDVTSASVVEKMVALTRRTLLGGHLFELSSEHSRICSEAVEQALRLQDLDATVHDSAELLCSVFPMFYAHMAVSSQVKRQHDSSKKKLSGRKHKKSQPLQQERADKKNNQDPPSERVKNKNKKQTLQSSLKVEHMSSDDRKVEQEVLRIQEENDKETASESPFELRRRVRVNFTEMSDFLDRMPGPGGPKRSLKQDRELKLINKPILLEQCEVQSSGFSYPEWDATIGALKPNWTTVIELRVMDGVSDFVTQVCQSYQMEIKRLRRAFEALRPEQFRIIKGLEHGEEFDLDRLLQACVERRAGVSLDPRIYQRRSKAERDTCVAFLLDMSSSTNELANDSGKRILDVEKEALILISEAINVLGDEFAIYGYSGYGKDQVAFYTVKEFEEDYDFRIQNRIGNISWKMENRDGAAIRHATKRLSAMSSRGKLLIILSDGKPLDCGCDQYFDDYAQSDTRFALREARQKGIRPFCITVDPYGQRYLPSLYGEQGYAVITKVEQLPQKLPRIYRRLTR